MYSFHPRLSSVRFSPIRPHWIQFRSHVISRRSSIYWQFRATEEEVLLEAESLELDAEDRMSKALIALNTKLNTIRTGRANPLIFDRIQVEYYGSPTPLKSLAGISVPDAATLLINPFDKTSIAEIEKAILTSDLGLTPSNDGEKIRINVPQLTEQRRKELVKTVGKICEESKVAIRNVRRDVVKAAGKVGLSEDVEKDFKNNLQESTDDMIRQIDAILKEKEKELTTI
eukprot:g6225.t1